MILTRHCHTYGFDSPLLSHFGDLQTRQTKGVCTEPLFGEFFILYYHFALDLSLYYAKCGERDRYGRRFQACNLPSTRL